MFTGGVVPACCTTPWLPLVGLASPIANPGATLVFLRNARARTDWLKAEIHDKITVMLGKITGKKNIVMQYKSYEKDIVIDHGVELVGWTHEVFSCPSSLSPALEPLQKLLQVIDDGQCHFKRLRTDEVKARRQEYERKQAEGIVPTRKECADKGKKRGKYRPRKKVIEQDGDEEEDQEDSARARKRRRPDDDAEHIPDSGSEG
ncbi:hypothetical protein K466DRAFT_603716 [Polyporus arcularius HHB13444]|uniref:Uncharacterized protein n=1 Tax=Polyporus arcularius HHB13444 TaxID=1314778 RepID=A0A5C3P1C7_9APHY|nr:hypothetical protein K466DRAFT_603716 [Polyporus arcularius HHB13444]